ncbi:MAG: SPOR domain-containing protein [Terriglobia bacterium]
MEQRTGLHPGARGLTVKQLAFIFISGVAVCAIFFTLGFLVGANERNVNASAATVERISPPGDIPPPVSGPLNTAPSSATNPAVAGAADSSGHVQEENIPPSGSARNSSTPAASTSLTPGPTPPVAATGKPPAFTQASPSPATGRPGSGLIVQIAALHSVKDATSLVATLRSQGYSAFLVTPEQAGTNDGVYRVQVGPYPTRRAAEKVKDKLVREGFSPFIK